MVSHQAPFARLLIYASLHIFYIRSHVAILRSGALGSFLRSGFALTLDAQLVAFRLADAVVGGNGDILHILDLRDTRVRRCALVFVGAHADLVDDGPIVVLIHTALLEALVHTELVVTVILNSLGQVLDSLFRSLTRVHAKVLGNLLIAFRSDVLVVLRPAGRLLRHEPL